MLIPFSSNKYLSALFLMFAAISLPANSTASVSLEKTLKAGSGGSQLSEVSAMLMGNEGHLLVLDRDQGAIFEYKGSAVSKIVITGDENVFESGELTGLSRVDEERYLIVNSSENAIAITNLKGELIKKFGENGELEGQLDEPAGIAWSMNGRLYIADKANNRVSVFGQDGVFIQSIGRVGLQEEFQLEEPVQVNVDAQERVYVLETHDNGIVSIFSLDGQLIKRLNSEKLHKITGNEVELAAMTIDDTGLLYLADNENGRIYQIDWQAEKLLASFGSRGEQRGQFEEIAALLIMPGNRIAVADNENNKIEIYRLPENHRKKLVKFFLPTIAFERSIRIECDKAYRLQGGNVLCLDNENDRVSTFKSSGKHVLDFDGEFSDLKAASVDDQDVVILDDVKVKIYKLDGRLRFEVGASGDADGQFDSPQGVFLGRDKIYVADTGNQRIQMFSRDGIYLNKIANDEDADEEIFQRPTRVAVDKNQNLFVLDKESRQVLVFSPENRLLYRIGENADADDDEDDDDEDIISSENSRSMNTVVFDDLYDLTVDPDDNLYVLGATENNHTTIQVYNGPVRIISFGSQGEGRVSLSEPDTISIPPARKTIVSVYDNELKQLKNYKFKQLPAKPGGLKVKGTIYKTYLSWNKVPGSYTSRYKVFGSRKKNGPYRFLTDVSGLSATVLHKGDYSPRYYRISAVSGFSVESEQSNIREDVFQAAYAAYRKADFERALELFTASYKEDNQLASVVKYMGLTSLKLGKLDDAVDFFAELSRLKGHEVEGNNLQIKALVENREYVAAKAVIDHLIEDNTASLDTIIYCGELSLKLGDAIGAIDCLEDAIKKDKQNTKARFLIGQAYIKLGLEDKGIKEFHAAEEIAPDNSQVWYQSGMAFFALERYEEAIKRFEKSLKLEASNSDAKLALARSHLALKHYDKARNIAIKLAGERKTEAEGHYLLGITAFAGKDYGQALLSLNKATRADPGNTDAWLALVDTYEKMNQAEKIRPALAKASEGNRHSFEAAYRLGLLDFSNGDYENAAAALARAVALKPDHFDAVYKLAYAQVKAGAYNSAAKHAAQAEKLQPKNVDTLTLQAEIFNRQGKNGEAIDYIKRAMRIEKNSAELHQRLGALYVDSSVYDMAEATLNKAILLNKASAVPYVLLGSLYSGRGMYDKAIKALDKAVELEPSAENKLALDTAYADQKSAAEFLRNAPKITIKDLQLEPVFSAAYKQYIKRPLGTVRIVNASSQDYKNLKVRFTIKDYMDFPYTLDLPLLKANSSEKLSLNAVFNNRILEIDEDTGVQVQIAVNFARNNQKDAIKLTYPMTIYGKNAIVWRDANMVGAFVTPKDDTLRDFVRQAINQNKPKADAVDNTVLSAMTLFDVYGTYGIDYVVDPNNSYAQLTQNSIDYVQFSRETLKLKSGDCDDLSVLFSSGLENLGIQTAILDVPGHLLMMFNTGLSNAERHLISLDDELLVLYKGTVWIPVEATMIGQSFSEAWAEGARKYYKYQKSHQLKIVELENAWREFKPVTLKPAVYQLSLPEPERVAIKVQREADLLLEKSLDRLVNPYRALVSMDADNIAARQQIAIIYAKYGLYSAANREFDEILKLDSDNSSVYNNRGNIYFSQDDYERAIEQYSYAEKLDANDAGIKMNVSMANYKSGQLQLASSKYREARVIDDSVSEKYAGYIKLLSR